MKRAKKPVFRPERGKAESAIALFRNARQDLNHARAYKRLYGPGPAIRDHVFLARMLCRRVRLAEKSM